MCCLWPRCRLLNTKGGERFENEEGVLQGIKFLLERRVCVVVRAQGRSGKKTVNTSLTGLFPSLFPLQCWPPPLSPARREVRIKTWCIWGCQSPCCTCSSAELQVFVATFVLPLLRGKGEGLQPRELCTGWLHYVWGAGKPWVLQGCSSAHNREAAECEVVLSVRLLQRPVYCSAIPFLPPK